MPDWNLQRQANLNFHPHMFQLHQVGLRMAPVLLLQPSLDILVKQPRYDSSWSDLQHPGRTSLKEALHACVPKHVSIPFLCANKGS